jgi:hypothetical protein
MRAVCVCVWTLSVVVAKLPAIAKTATTTTTHNLGALPGLGALLHTPTNDGRATEVHQGTPTPHAASV